MLCRVKSSKAQTQIMDHFQARNVRFTGFLAKFIIIQTAVVFSADVADPQTPHCPLVQGGQERAKPLTGHVERTEKNAEQTAPKMSEMYTRSLGSPSKDDDDLELEYKAVMKTHLLNL